MVSKGYQQVQSQPRCCILWIFCSRWVLLIYFWLCWSWWNWGRWGRSQELGMQHRNEPEGVFLSSFQCFRKGKHCTKRSRGMYSRSRLDDLLVFPWYCWNRYWLSRVFKRTWCNECSILRRSRKSRDHIQRKWCRSKHRATQWPWCRWKLWVARCMYQCGNFTPILSFSQNRLLFPWNQFFLYFHVFSDPHQLITNDLCPWYHW